MLKTELVQLTLVDTATLEADLTSYANAYSDVYGITVEVRVLVPHMLDTFILGDRRFQKTRRVAEKIDLNAGGDG